MKLSALNSTISAESIAAAVDGRYAIGPVAHCALFQRGFNHIYELWGADGRSYVARLSSHRFRGPANVDYETALLMHLHKMGIVVGVPVADGEGRLWSLQDAPEGPRELAVFERLNGRGLVEAVRGRGEAAEQTLADVGALGASLARIHLAGETYAGPSSLYRAEAPDLLEAPLAQILTVFEGELAEEASAIGDNLRARLNDCAEALSSGHCHGDNHAGNTLIADAADGTLVAGWFDFDDGGPGFLAYDLATFLWSLLLRTPKGKMTKEIPPLWRAFITAYRGVRAIPSADFDAVGLLVAIRHVWLMGNYASRVAGTGVNSITADWFRQGLGLVRNWDGLAAPAVDG